MAQGYEPDRCRYVIPGYADCVTAAPPAAVLGATFHPTLAPPRRSTVLFARHPAPAQAAEPA